MRASVRITTRFPSVEETAAKLGLSKNRIRLLSELMDKIQEEDASNQVSRRTVHLTPGSRKTSQYLAERMGVTNRVARELLDSLVELAVQQTKKKGIFVLPGLGLMKKVERKARMGRNPATGEPIRVSAKTTVKFYVSKAARKAVVPSGRNRKK